MYPASGNETDMPACFSYFISIGSMVDVDFGDIINYFGNDSSVKSILLYIENLTNFRKCFLRCRPSWPETWL